MAHRPHVYWWTPFLLFASLLVGVVFALGHHFFYRSLADKPTSTGSYSIAGHQYPDQQVNIAVGTAFAFLAKAALVLAVSTAYYQVFWRSVRREADIGRPPTLARTDSAFSAPTNIISLLNAPVWVRYPLLCMMALTMWLIPIASIVAPATLSVELRENVGNSTLENIPRIDFSNLDFAAAMPGSIGVNRISPYYTYNGPSQITKKTAMAVVAQQAILPITPPFPNSSWALDFDGPSLQCNPMDSSRDLDFQANIASYTALNCNSAPTFLSWFPRFSYSIDQNQTTHEPFSGWLSDNQTTMSWLDPETIYKTGIGNFKLVKQDAILYIAVMPAMTNKRQFTLTADPVACDLSGNQSTEDPPTPENPLGIVGGNVTMIQCELHNSTYKAQFEYKNGAQNVSVDLPQHGPTVPIINWIRSAWTGEDKSSNCTTLNELDNDYGKICTYDDGLTSQIAYQSILQAFTALITGQISLDNTTGGLLDTSSIRSTSLVNTKELEYLTDYGLHLKSSQSTDGHDDPFPDLQWTLSNSSMPGISGISKLQQQGPATQSLQDALEIMFQNFTISLMSSALLQPNYSSPSAPPKATVTTFTAQTVYVYAAGTLWAAYGAAAFCTLICVLIGMYTIIASGATYNNSFSTILRVARAAELSTEVKREDLDGKSPLPEYLAKATVSIESRKRNVEVVRSVVRGKDAGAGETLLS
ncbi:hypothetical protein K491DRAFT_755910 [Lophiostoma macrostomum CBS 122681]|uniref:Uncharacterized protein n=1 Tax=Lophiostoma macrostomum CBS 122681 TaxID=1314788 RepID=A0A6A6TFU1_9PLEO|nr:hypothetical protein K491DRAFT_755910 [Lophiostoma macrostomum CBS 122681]